MSPLHFHVTHLSNHVLLQAYQRDTYCFYNNYLSITYVMQEEGCAPMPRGYINN